MASDAHAACCRCTGHTFVQAIHAAAEGDALIAPSVTGRLLSTLANATNRHTVVQPIEPLTEREEEVLLTVASGRTNAEIPAPAMANA